MALIATEVTSSRRAIVLGDRDASTGHAASHLGDPEQSGLDGDPAELSEREREVLRFLGEGLMNKQIAQELRIHPETVKSHVKHIFRKLGVERRAHAVMKGYGLGLIGSSPA